MNAKQPQTHIKANGHSSLVIERAELLYYFSVIEFFLRRSFQGRISSERFLSEC
jgi:hypothetical protein